MRSLYWSETGANGRGRQPQGQDGNSQDGPPTLPGRSYDAERLRRRQPVAALLEAGRATAIRSAWSHQLPPRDHAHDLLPDLGHGDLRLPNEWPHFGPTCCSAGWRTANSVEDTTTA